MEEEDQGLRVMRRLIILYSLATVLLVILLFAAACRETAPSAEDTDNLTPATVTEDDFQNSVANMKTHQESLEFDNLLTQNPYCKAFLGISDNFTHNINNLREAVKNNEPERARDLLNAVYAQYPSMYDYADKVCDITCNVLMFMEEADNSIEVVTKEVEILTREIKESVSELEGMADEKEAICDNITIKNEELRENREKPDEEWELLMELITCREITQPEGGTDSVPPPAGPEDDFQVHVENMQGYWTSLNNTSSNLATPNQDYEAFLAISDDFTHNIKNLREAVKNRNLEKTNELLDTVNAQYPSMYDYADKVCDITCNVLMFMEEAEESTGIVIEEVGTLTQEIKESVSELEKKRNETKVTLDSLIGENKELQESYEELEKKRKSWQISKWREAKNVLFHLALPIAAAFVVGFIVLIPWYKKFAQEEEYWGFSVKKTGRISPVTIMMFIVIAILAILIGYTAYKGYIGALL